MIEKTRETSKCGSVQDAVRLLECHINDVKRMQRGIVEGNYSNVSVSISFTKLPDNHEGSIL